MENTIRKLTDDNRMVNSKSSSNAKDEFRYINSSSESSSFTRMEEFNNLKDKVNFIMKEYTELESKMHSNELEWVIWKEQWITEKNIYLNKIKQLEAKSKANNKFS